MLLAHKIQLYPDEAQAEYLRRCIGARRSAAEGDDCVMWQMNTTETLIWISLIVLMAMAAQAMLAG